MHAEGCHEVFRILFMYTCKRIFFNTYPITIYLLCVVSFHFQKDCRIHPGKFYDLRRWCIKTIEQNLSHEGDVSCNSPIKPFLTDLTILQKRNSKQTRYEMSRRSPALFPIFPPPRDFPGSPLDSRKSKVSLLPAKILYPRKMWLIQEHSFSKTVGGCHAKTTNYVPPTS
jgi:hypothetical protein